MASLIDQLAHVSVTTDGDEVLVEVRGDLDLQVAPRVRDVLFSLSRDGVRDITVDLRNCLFVDSTALAVLLNARRRCRSAGGDLVLREPSRQTVRLLAVSGLSAYFRLEGAVPSLVPSKTA